MSVAELARKWVGTPYRHQASCRGAGADCLGLIRGVWRELYGHDLLVPLTYSADWAERRDDEPLWAGLTRWMVPCFGTGATCDDVILFRMSTRAAAKHLGIVVQDGSAPRFVHACSGLGVVETALSPSWVRRVVARFVFP
jgi:NlpC/P60 family putative phage cell wall peptidase